MKIKRVTLNRAAKYNPEGLKRLADFLNLRTEGMSSRQIAALIYWRITRRDKHLTNIDGLWKK